MSSLTVQVMRREFRLGGKKLPDPNPKLEPEGVRGVYAPQFPEIVNAVIEGPVLEAGVRVYRFATRVGKNG
jgi:PRTRC genetic system protein C